MGPVERNHHGKGRTRTLPGRYSVGSWQSLPADDAQRVLEEEIIATQRLMVVRCLYRPGSDFAPHLHQQEQITIVESGTLEFTVNGDTIKVAAGQMISIFPGVLHGSRVLGSEPARALNIFHAAADRRTTARSGRLTRLPGIA
ncbi:MAG: cupin domain-containing protein [Candidatus Eisenbacteria sp.]|nr:cupin domain-containing protein [Candidatus Eisenbacteria bacterium]